MSSLTSTPRVSNQRVSNQRVSNQRVSNQRVSNQRKRRYAPRDPAPPLRYACGVCSVSFITLELFDSHREDESCISVKPEIPTPEVSISQVPESLPKPEIPPPPKRSPLPQSRPPIFAVDAINLTGLTR